MSKSLLMELLAVPTDSYKEQIIAGWLTRYIKRNIPGAVVTTDKFRNVYVTKGTAEFYPCVAAHIDSVHAIQGINIKEEDGCLVGYDDHGKRCGIGGDDKAGVYVCLRLLQYVSTLKVVFFASEEVGCVGARNANSEFFADIGYLIEFDCPSHSMLSYTCGGTRLFANDGDFIKTAQTVLPHLGVDLWQHHPFTDVMIVRQRFPISCLNLSCGYHNWHQSLEYVSLADVEWAVAVGGSLLLTLGTNNYPCPLDLPYDDNIEPLVKVSRLMVPERLSPAVYPPLPQPSCV